MISQDVKQEGLDIGALVTFDTSQDEEIMVKIGVSFIDMEQAKRNLEMEIPAWDFDKVKMMVEKFGIMHWENKNRRRDR